MRLGQIACLLGRKLRSSVALIRRRQASKNKRYGPRNARLKRGVSTLLSFDHAFVNSYGCGGFQDKVKTKRNHLRRQSSIAGCWLSRRAAPNDVASYISQNGRPHISCLLSPVAPFMAGLVVSHPAICHKRANFSSDDSMKSYHTQNRFSYWLGYS